VAATGFSLTHTLRKGLRQRSSDYPGVGHKCHFGPCGPTFSHRIGLCGVTHAGFSHKPLWMVFPVF